MRLKELIFSDSSDIYELLDGLDCGFKEFYETIDKKKIYLLLKNPKPRLASIKLSWNV